MFLTSSYYKNRFYLHIRLYKKRSTSSTLADEDDSNNLDDDFYPTQMGVVYHVDQFSNLIAGLEKMLETIIKKDYESRSNPEARKSFLQTTDDDSENEEDAVVTFTE